MSAYRTAQGKMIDMSQLAARNEKVRAVGNMNVNARGDIIDSHNKVIQDNTKRVKSSYTKAVNEKQSKGVKPHPQQAQPKNIPIVEDLSKDEKEFFDDDEDIIK